MPFICGIAYRFQRKRKSETQLKKITAPRRGRIVSIRGERLVLKDAAANDLAGDSGQHLVVARRQNVNAGNLGFLVQRRGRETRPSP